ncbi:unnamed protein product [Phytophthora fragariaefolia]|uniref:Unnamed protein product n=1 Tax=Phytophthora fragariaefolia TaxID=1490495 RepID=A0A9W6Y406_9STRA|nr:unnamed protein product [Phytophthora fragariaefolia]
MNNEMMATHTGGANPQTLDEAVQYAEDKCGEYGEGRSVTDWREADRLYRLRRSPAGDDEAARRRGEKPEVSSQIDWKKLGLGFGGDEKAPVYDMAGKAVTALAETAKKDPLSLAALQALMTMVGVGKIAEAGGQSNRPAAAKSKARALEVKAERRADAEDDYQEHAAPVASHGWRSDGAGGTAGRGFGGRWSGRGRGRGGGRGYAAGHYGPADPKPIAQQKAESECSYCGKRGHWWRECAVRAPTMAAADAPQAAAVISSQGPAEATPAAATTAAAQQQGNARRHVNGPEEMMTARLECAADDDALANGESCRTGGGSTWGKSSTARNGSGWGKGSPARSSAAWGKGGREAAPARNATVAGDAQEVTKTDAGGAVAEKRVAEADAGDGSHDQADVMQPERALESSAGAEDPMNEAAAVHEMATLASDAVTIAAAADCEQPTPQRQMPVTPLKKQLLVSGGVTTAAKRRQQCLETELAAARNILIAELREEFAERAKVLREEVKRVIAELREVKDLRHERRRRRDAQQRITVDALLVDGQGDEFLIGEDWMLEKQIKMDFGSRELKYRDEKGQKVILPFTCHGVRTLSQNGERWAIVRLAKTVKLATNTRSVVRAKVDAADVLNVEGRREKLPAREALAKWIPTDADMEILAVNGELERSRVASWVATLRRGDAKPLRDEDKLDIGEMEMADRDLVVALLRHYADIVEKKEGCPPLSKTGVIHHINTGNAAPIMLGRRRHAVAERAIIDKEVDAMLKNGVIEEGSGVWGFPVVLVKKKDGTVRFCIDYRALNAITVKDVYPLPRVDETLEALHGAQRFTSLNLHAGYWQLGVAAEDKPKTAFTTRRGLFQFRRMPFGLCNAPSTFQRLMNCVLRGLTWVCCLGYLDDVIIFTRGTVARHVVELAVVLERLAEAGLSLKAAKCSFAATSMEYFGHDLTPEGIRPTDRLIKAIADFPKPQDEAAVRTFVALAGYYRRFMPEYGSKMAPLTKLLRKTNDWSWAYPDYRPPFKLTTDASKTGLGAVLSQDQGKGDQPVAYASKVNSPMVAKYSSSELECLAVVWAVKLFRPHLYGRKFTIVTDHVALKWLMTAKEPAGRLHRWALTLQEYDFEIQYRPGRENHVADALSRGPAAEAESEEPEAENDPVIVSPRPADAIVAAAVDSKAAAVRRTMESISSKHPVSSCSSSNSPTYSRMQNTPTRCITKAEVADEVAKQVAKNAFAADGKQPTLTNDLDADVNRAAATAVQTAVVWRVDAAELGIVQFTDDDIKREQAKSVLVQTLKQKGSYRGQSVTTNADGLVIITLGEGETRIVLPTIYWALAFKEAHDSIWAGHLRVPQTYERLRRMYWWPNMRDAVRSWVSACQDCVSRKARPQVVVPPLRSVKTGDVCDRWAVDVVGPLPVTAHGNRYVIAAVEYTTRYAVAAAVEEHTATSIAKFLMNKVVLVYGPMREVMMDGAREFGSQVVSELLELLQAKQSTPVPYRPKLLGLRERFHHTWKDIISLYVDVEQNDWDDFLPCALYAYNGSKHATHGFQPNELMLGRKLRTPAELLRRSRLKHPHQTLADYHETLMQDLKTARELAAVALQKEQARQAIYYNQRNVRQRAEFRTGQLVWIYRPARGPGITKLGHRWRGPGQIVEAAGYDNYLVKMLESDQEVVTYCSFLLPYYYPTHLLEEMERDIAVDLREEAIAAADLDPEDEIDAPQVDGAAEISSSVPENNSAAADENGASAADANGAAAADENGAAAVDENDAAVPDTTGVVHNQQPSQEAETPNAVSDVTPKRRRGRPKKNVPAAAAIADERAAGSLTADERPSKRRRTRIIAAVPEDAVARRTRTRMQRDSQTRIGSSNSRDAARSGSSTEMEADESNPINAEGRVQAADAEAAATRRPNSIEVSQPPSDRPEDAAQTTGIVPTAAEAGNETSIQPIEQQPTEQSTAEQQRAEHPAAAAEEEAQIYVFASRVGEELIASYPRGRDLIAYAQMKPWWSVEGEGTELVLGDTYWSLSLSVWVVDLTNLPDDCGSTSTITSSCGVMDACTPTQMTTMVTKTTMIQPNRIPKQLQQQMTHQLERQQLLESRTIRCGGEESEQGDTLCAVLPCADAAEDPCDYQDAADNSKYDERDSRRENEDGSSRLSEDDSRPGKYRQREDSGDDDGSATETEDEDNPEQAAATDEVWSCRTQDGAA